MGDTKKRGANQGSGVGGRAGKRRNWSSLPASHVVAQMLAASYRIHTDLGRSMVVGFQDLILRALQKSSKDSSMVEGLLSDGLFAAMPVLLGSGLPQVSLNTAEIIGAAALWSYGINMKVASDKEVVKTLVAMISNPNEEFAVAACNAVLDLATTSIGRESLRESGAIAQLLFLFCQVARSPCKGSFLSSKKSDAIVQKHFSSLSALDTRFQMGVDTFLTLILDALGVLIFDDNGNPLEMVSEKLVGATLSCLKNLWAGFQDQHWNEMQKSDCRYMDKLPIPISGKSHSIARMIFRLAIEQNVYGCLTHPVDEVKKSIFGGRDTCFEHFIQHHWECSPMLIRRMSKGEHENDIIASLIEGAQKKNIDAILNQLLSGMISCPPVTSDNLNVLHFLEEIEEGLSHSIIYGQDIRIIKSVTEELSVGSSQTILGTKEQHFFEENSDTSITDGPKFVCLQDCKQAYEMGYTIAIRGMEFRSPKIAAVADALAVIFGQASVGANLYLTPPNSQGLAAHYDDHCVLVCQLAGDKRWNIFPPEKLLPRLYEPVSAVQNAKDNMANLKEILLTEGDILYIPRGFPHAACTISGNSNHDGSVFDSDACFCGSGTELSSPVKPTNIRDKKYGSNNFWSSQADCTNRLSSQRCAVDETSIDGYSLHLTFGIEVEPPFEWEGIIHIALHCWAQRQKWESFLPSNDSQKMFNLIVELLHISIRSIGDSCNLFRKACMIEATPFCCYNGWNKKWEEELGSVTHNDTFSHRHHQNGLASEDVFAMLMGIVTRSCSFADAYRVVQVTISSLDCNSWGWMRWLRHLSSEHTNSPCSLNDAFMLFREMFQPDKPNVVEYERVFFQVKSKFYNEVKFEEAQKHFKRLLKKYRDARKQFINGMLGLHSSSMEDN